MLPCARVDGIAPTYLSAARSPGSRRNMAAIRIEYARVRFHGENGRARGPARVGAGPSTSASQDLGHHRTPKSQSAICKPLPSAAHHTSPSMRPSASERLIRLLSFPKSSSGLDSRREVESSLASAWLRRNVRQVCDGGPRRRIIYLETVDSAISNPSLSSSPWMRGAPHNGFSLLIR